MVPKKTSYKIFFSCCHHKCRWATFSSRKYLEKFSTAKSFRLLTLLSSWHTCGFEKSDDEKLKFGLTVPEKQKIGATAKYLIDEARMKFCSEKFEKFSAKLEQYCCLETSLECRSIIISKN